MLSIRITMAKAALASAAFFTVTAAQPKSALEFYDSTGTNATARFGWQGSAVDGRFFIEAPPGTDVVTVEGGDMTVRGEVSATKVNGDGSGLSNIGSSQITDGAISTADLEDSAVTGRKIRNGTIMDADIHSNARISGSKIVPDFGNIVLEPDRYTNATFIKMSRGQSENPFAIAVARDDRAAGSQRYLSLGFDTTANTARGMILVYADESPSWASLQFAGRAYFNNNVAVNGAVTATSCCGASDLRLKRDIVPLRNALSKVLDLSGVQFRWDEEPQKENWQVPDSNTHIGLIAQEVEEVLPEVVHADGRGYKSVEYDKLTTLLVEAVKEQQKQIEEQRSALEAQASRIAALEEMVNKHARKRGPGTREH